MTPREIVSELDQLLSAKKEAKKSGCDRHYVTVGEECSLQEPLRHEVTPKIF